MLKGIARYTDSSAERWNVASIAKNENAISIRENEG
jgi:hypothetical protein